MNKYMLILFESAESYATMTPEEYQNEINEHGKWIAELGERYHSGEPLENDAFSIRGKEKLVTDGPFIEAKELVSGFYILTANSLEEATELSKGCPILRVGGSVEVRPVMHFEM
jgi:hypothetical protein